MAISLRALAAELQPYAYALVDAASESGWNPRVTSTLRSHREQAFLYRRFLAGRSAFPVAPPGHSAHEYGLAFDLVTEPFSALDDLGTLWESWGGVWGGRKQDVIHFEAGGSGEAIKSLFQEILENPLVKLASYALPLPLAYTTEPEVNLVPDFLRRFQR